MDFRDGYLLNDYSQYLCTSVVERGLYSIVIGNDLFHHTFLTDRGNTLFRRVASIFHCVVQFPASTFPVSFTPCIFSNVERRQCITYGTRLVRIPIVPSSIDPAKRVTTRRYIFSPFR